MKHHTHLGIAITGLTFWLLQTKYCFIIHKTMNLCQNFLQKVSHYKLILNSFVLNFNFKWGEDLSSMTWFTSHSNVFLIYLSWQIKINSFLLGDCVLLVGSVYFSDHSINGQVVACWSADNIPGIQSQTKPGHRSLIPTNVKD